MPKFLLILISFTLYFIQNTGVAQSVTEANPKPSELLPPSKWKMDWNSDMTFALGYRDVAEATINPANRIFESDRLNARLDYNFNYKAEIPGKLAFVVKPRLSGKSIRIDYTDNNSMNQKNDGKADFVEAYMDYSILKDLNFVLGQQNFQWGPAELISPSNFLYHFSQTQQSIFWRDRGHVMARLNWSLGISWTFIFLNEFMSNGDPSWTYGNIFQSRNMLKIEYRSKVNPTNYFGLTIGQNENLQNALGEYFNVSFADWISFYVDARHILYPTAYYPQLSGVAYNMNLATRGPQNNTSDNTILAGLRFEGTYDFRIEYFSQSMGYERREFQNALLSSVVLNPNYQLNLQKLQRTGLELFGKEYIYSSFRFSNFFRDQTESLILRYFYSLMDYSNAFQLNWEKGFGKRWTFFFEGLAKFGDNNLEFTLYDRGTALFGIKGVY